MIATTCEPLEKTSVTSGLKRKRGRERNRRGLYYGHKLEIEFEMPMKRLNTELFVAGSFTLPTGLDASSLSFSVLNDQAMRLATAQGGCSE